jgi:RNA polymerase sigma factor (sigma-70 family)
VLREHLVAENLGLAYSMIKRFNHLKLDPDELQSESMFALARAVDRFDPWRGYRFSTYACTVIARALTRRDRRDRQRRQHHAVAFDGSFDQAAPLTDRHTDLYVDRLRRALKVNSGRLTQLEQTVIGYRFPNDRGRRQTFREIASMVSLSKERVRQIQSTALTKLRGVLDDDVSLQ